MIPTNEEMAAQVMLSDMLYKFAARLRPAVLKNTHRNGRLLAEYVQEQNLPQTAESFYLAANAIYRTLEWHVPPKKLVLEQESGKGMKLTSAQSSENEFASKVRAGEAADAKAKLDAASIKQCRHLIAGYTPLRTTSRGSAVDYWQQSIKQTLWTTNLDAAIDTQADLQSHAAALVIQIEQAYREAEAKNERL